VVYLFVTCLSRGDSIVLGSSHTLSTELVLTVEEDSTWRYL
jgi:hypothetical protein